MTMFSMSQSHFWFKFCGGTSSHHDHQIMQQLADLLLTQGLCVWFRRSNVLVGKVLPGFEQTISSVKKLDEIW
jgi:hypothetical protein